MHLGKLDLIFIVIISFFLIRGFFKGLIKQAFGLISFFASIIVSFLLTKPIANFLSQTQFAFTLNNKVSEWLLSKGSFFAMTITTSSEAMYSKAIEASSLPNFINKIMVNFITKNDYVGQTVSSVLSPFVSRLIIIIGSFIMLFIITIIFFKILSSIFTSAVSDSIFGLINRLLGGAFGLAKALIIITVFLSVLSFLAKVPFVGSSIDKLLFDDLNVTDEFCLVKYLYENNLFSFFINKS